MKKYKYIILRINNKLSFFKKLGLLLFFLFYMPAICNSSDINPLTYWQADMQWNVEAIYKNIEGNWSEPRIWHFKIVNADKSHFEINIASEGGSPDAQIFLDRESGQINRILMTEILKGKSLKKEISFQGLSPVYPLFSVIPFHMPVFLSDNKTYHLNQKINNREGTDEELMQSVYTVKKEDIADINGLKDFSSVILQEGIGFEISKKKRMIFKQYWFPGLPWAVYTESQNIKAWLIPD